MIIPTFYYCTKSALLPKILHTYSIDTPYILHSFDGVTIEILRR